MRVWVLLALVTIAASALPQLPSSQPARVPDIGYEPTPPDVVDAMLTLARVGPSDTVYDLGSGDGRFPIIAARAVALGGVGIEMQPALVRASRQAAHEAGVDDKVTFVEQDLFDADLSPATVVMLYLWPGLNDSLEPKLRRELRPGARIVSYTFGMSHWVPETTERLDNGRDLSLWIVPRRPARRTCPSDRHRSQSSSRCWSSRMWDRRMWSWTSDPVTDESRLSRPRRITRAASASKSSRNWSNARGASRRTATSPIASRSSKGISSTRTCRRRPSSPCVCPLASTRGSSPDCGACSPARGSCHGTIRLAAGRPTGRFAPTTAAN